MTNFRIYHESASSIKSALTREGKKREEDGSTKIWKFWGQKELFW